MLVHLLLSVLAPGKLSEKATQTAENKIAQESLPHKTKHCKDTKSAKNGLVPLELFPTTVPTKNKDDSVEVVGDESDTDMNEVCVHDFARATCTLV